MHHSSGSIQPFRSDAPIVVLAVFCVACTVDRETAVGDDVSTRLQTNERGQYLRRIALELQVVPAQHGQKGFPGAMLVVVKTPRRGIPKRGNRSLEFEEGPHPLTGFP